MSTTNKPLIGISCELKPPDPRRSFSRKREILTLNRDYVQAVARCGGSPMIIPLMQGADSSEFIARGLHGIILSGGDDVAAPHGEWQVRPECQLRSSHEQRLIEVARRQRIPILGICRGLQQLNVSFGGSIWEDLPAWKPGAIDHRRGKRNSAFRHKVHLEGGSWLDSILGGAEAEVNSSHHQAAQMMPDGLRAVAFAEDGVIEALESTLGELVWAVQWHPERLGDQPGGDHLLKWFLATCAKNRTWDY
jgi:putative glutamine amidotransferase